MNLKTGEARELQGLGLYLASARLERGLSQLELAHRCRLAQAQISYFESGRRRPTLDQLLRIARALDVSLQNMARIRPRRPSATIIEATPEVRQAPRSQSTRRP
jgi:transcriptional regulator with XRE-family HTH domain